MSLFKTNIQISIGPSNKAIKAPVAKASDDGFLLQNSRVLKNMCDIQN